MGTRRIMYIITLVGAVLFYILYSYWFSWYLLILILILIPLDMLVSLPGMLTRRIIVTAPKVLRQDSEGLLTIVPVQLGPFHIRCIKARLNTICDGFTETHRIIYSAERHSRHEIMIDTSRSGITVFKIKRIWAVSIIGLFSIPTTVNCRAAVLILPAPVKPPQTISLPRGVTLRTKPGGGFADDHDLRPYRQGDPIKTIHWKVSAKHDSLIVRDPLIPPLHSRIIRVVMWNSAGERDLILGRLLWLSDYLIQLGLYYFIKLGDDEPVAEITGAGHLENYLYHVLSGLSYLLPKPVTLPARFTWEYRVDADTVRSTGVDGGKSR